VAARIFLLSPADCRGRRAQRITAAQAAFPLAARLRSGPGVPIGELFAHLSALYFRGKLTYAERFARPSPNGGPGTLIITPHRGLVAPDVEVTLDGLRKFGEIDIREDSPLYRQPLETSAADLLSRLEPTAEIVLLGSVASNKYVSILSEVFGLRLLFPAEFVGRGDMSRGGLLLRAAAAGRELDYVPVAGAVRRGARPPRLDPAKRRGGPAR
jgi:hypothetical protein